MNTGLWIVQILLALAFLVAGWSKVTLPYEKVVERMSFAKDFSPNTVRVIGTLEVLGALGIVLPALTGILTWLTPLAALGLVLTMIGAALTNFRRGAYNQIAADVVLLALAAFVVYGRFVAVPL